MDQRTHTDLIRLQRSARRRRRERRKRALLRFVVQWVLVMSAVVVALLVWSRIEGTLLQRSLTQWRSR